MALKLPKDTPPAITQADVDDYKRKKKAGTLPPAPKKPVHPRDKK